MRGKMRSRYGDLFTRRIIITIPKGGAFAIALAVLLSTVIASRMLGVISVCVSLAGLAVVGMARREVRAMRYEAARAFKAIDGDDSNVVTFEPRVPTKQIEMVNGATSDFVRVPKS